MANRRQPGKKPRKEGKRTAKPSGHLIVTEGIKTAWSNECIELWFLLHFAYLDTSIPRDAYYAKLSAELRKRGGPDKYEKADSGLYEFLKPYQRKAIANAQRLKNSFAPSAAFSKRNPCTTVDELVMELIAILERED
ncbi:RloB family protein [Saccharibacillus sp. CPCC 101409]|uniref:RloB family protein n=1 Tax=Saccharibacillus sp. CPCC 101409 TaxID=3058041 RepID=UPI002672610C|nr:RloB family protein [Saccharibacillus sp. CPCC 101409]MDO3408508.1 RloB family protein [Saccharibacillus sp. CPCC 101409]